jgi:hypothetical protein
LHEALAKRRTSCIRRLAGTRAREMQFTRFLRNPAVTAEEMATYAASRTAERVSGRHIVVIEDTTQLVLGGRKARANGFGTVGKGGVLSGLLLHALLAVDVGTGGVIGLAGMKIWNRKGKAAPRRGRATAEKESQRWVDGNARVGEVLATAASITVVRDREADFFEQFASCPANVQQIVRVCQNRRVKSGSEGEASVLLFDYIDTLPEQGRFTVDVPAAPGRKARTAELALRFSPVVLRKPLHGAAHDLPETVVLNLVDVHEVSPPEDGEPLHWRLLTTHSVIGLEDARRIIDLYRLRWKIEEFFRTLKTAGFDLEAADIGDPWAMTNFAAAATIAAVTVMQLVQARDGTTDQLLTDAFEPDDEVILEAVSAKLEGKTALQKNPHPKGSLAFAAWVIARLGGWTGYYGKPGPLVMRRGLDDFQRIKYGVQLGLQNV